MLHLQRFELADLEINNSFFDMFVDTQRHEVHILDLDTPASCTITNNVRTSFFEEIQSFLVNHFHYCFLDNILSYELYLYGTDGIVSRYYLETESFGPVDPFAALYEPYNVTMRARYADHFLGGEKPEEKRKWPTLLIATARAEIEREQEIERQAEIEGFNDANGFD